MTQFQIFAKDQNVIEVTASDPAGVLQIANRQNLDAGDVYQEGHYLFSFTCSPGQCWLIEGKSGQPIVERPQVEA